MSFVCHASHTQQVRRRLAADIGTRQTDHLFVGVGDDRRWHVGELRWFVGAVTRIATGTCRHSTGRRWLSVPAKVAAAVADRDQPEASPPSVG